MRKTFLVERYWPDITGETLAAAIGRGLAAEEAMAREGRSVSHVSTTLVPGDEAVFSVFEADSAEDVAALNARAEIPFDRIVEAVAFGAETQDQGEAV